ncbi:hypothetical protein TNIN_319111 [Trichonephila inaurata madagascariensis]|uniref:Uncharacterized protein n=1 Tax=Trichonephila inaurata madagascariensis TaxID=2747483 RepID=A0A8X6IV02_9ARAC|nr:hypothetical protein TNIN_319111 [Trichonephila inaurata madagascariensis]
MEVSKNSGQIFNPFGTAWINSALELYRTLANELYGALASTRRVCYQQNILRHRELGIITERRLRFCSNVRYRHACRCQMPQKLDNQNRGPAQCRITWPLERLGETVEMEQNFKFLNRTKESRINILKPYCGSSYNLSEA